MSDTQPLGPCMIVCRALGSVFVSLSSAGNSPNTHHVTGSVDVDGIAIQPDDLAEDGSLDP